MPGVESLERQDYDECQAGVEIFGLRNILKRRVR